MKFYSTKDTSRTASHSIVDAILQGLAPDGGLFMPSTIESLNSFSPKRLKEHSAHALMAELLSPFFKELYERSELEQLLEEALNFPTPLIQLEENSYVLELFQGPTMAFKDFGARVMARVLGNIEANNKTQLEGKRTVLVATSGDTGGAVAAGFHGVENIRVIILYPKNKISPLQRAQMHSFAFGDESNVQAIAVNGTFDDCQKLVKAAFGSKELSKKFGLTSANSINLARLLPQTCYYVNGVKQFYELAAVDAPAPTFCVPSGNFGNCTAGIISQFRGLPISGFIAATNENKVFIDYLNKGTLKPQPSIQTISNAMDVGNPSNFERIRELFENSAINPDNHQLSSNIQGYWFSDKETKAEIARTHQEQQYVTDPHTAVGLLASKKWRKENKGKNVITLATAHPGKFTEVVSEVIPEVKGAIDLSSRYPVANEQSEEQPLEATLKALEGILTSQWLCQKNKNS